MCIFQYTLQFWSKSKFWSRHRLVFLAWNVPSSNKDAASMPLVCDNVTACTLLKTNNWQYYCLISFASAFSCCSSRFCLYCSWNVGIIGLTISLSSFLMRFESVVLFFPQPGLTQRDKWFCRTWCLSLTKGPIVVPTLFFSFFRNLRRRAGNRFL